MPAQIVDLAGAAEFFIAGLVTQVFSLAHQMSVNRQGAVAMAAEAGGGRQRDRAALHPSGVASPAAPIQATETAAELGACGGGEERIST